METTQRTAQLNIQPTYPTNLICFSHLKWDFVYQRPQHIMTRLSKQYNVFFIEEPIWCNDEDRYEINKNGNVSVVKFWVNKSPVIPGRTRLHLLLDKFIKQQQLQHHIAWYYTPMALDFSKHLQSALTVYDCMDELSAFKFAPQELKDFEKLLFKKSELVFTGGHSLYEAKKHYHHNIYPFPSSIQKEHFAQAKNLLPQPEDQKNIPSKRLGFYGVVDERFNIKLIEEVATKRPDWQLVIIGPVVKIEESSLPRLKNIHYLGGKTYAQLPVYLSGWDIAFIPFAKNESTQFISPTKTPEYLAAGKPVISTSITDVVNPYGVQNLVYIADTADEFISAAEEIFTMQPEEQHTWQERVDEFLSALSWDITVDNIVNRMQEALNNAHTPAKTSLKSVA